MAAKAPDVPGHRIVSPSLNDSFVPFQPLLAILSHLLSPLALDKSCCMTVSASLLAV